jgi:hypothetical protein
MPPDRGGFTWDALSGRYRGAGGRYVAHAQIRAWLDVALDNASERMAALVRQLQARNIDLVTWQIRMAREIKNVQLYSAAAAKGGWAQFSNADLGRVGQSVRAQLEYLNNFAREVRTGVQPLDGRFVARVKLYAQSGRGIFHRTERLEMEVRGYDEEQSIRYAGDSCAGCVQEAARGWVRIGTLIPVGQRTCRGNDRCSIRYKRSTTGEVTR